MAVEIPTRPFRVTYATARLQTLDGGAPVSPWTVEKELGHGAPVSIYAVSRELGHGSEDMVRRVYSHLGTVRHRTEVVEFRTVWADWSRFGGAP